MLRLLTRYVVITLDERARRRQTLTPGRQVVGFGLIIGSRDSLLERFAEGGQTPLATVLFTLAWCSGITAWYATLALPLGLYRQASPPRGQ